MNYLARKIIVWYNDKEWAKKIYSEVRSSFPKVLKESISENNLWFECVDGTLFRMVLVNDYARGYRAHENYIQVGIDKELYQTIIEPHLIQPATEAWIITNAKQLYQGAMRASEYYNTI